MKMIPLCLIALLAASAGADAADKSARSVSLTQTPLVMRLDKNEFRIAFGINGERCAPTGCQGLIRYRVDWKAVDGVVRSERKQVNYVISPNAGRTIAVGHEVFDAAGGGHVTDIVKVKVDEITCGDVQAL